MTNSYFATPLIFIISTVCFLYMVVIALRIIMQWAHWEYHHPLVQFIIHTTQPPVKLLRRFFPAIGRWDTATIVLLLLVSLIKLVIVNLLAGHFPTGFSLINMLLADIFRLFIQIFTFSIIIEALLSWIAATDTANPIEPLLRSMNAPLLQPVRRIFPPIAGLDLSPLLVLICLQVISMLILPLLSI